MTIVNQKKPRLNPPRKVQLNFLQDKALQYAGKPEGNRWSGL